MLVDNAPEKPEVLVVDEQELFRKGLRAALEEAGLVIAGDFCSEEEVPLLTEMRPHTVAVCSLSLAHWDHLVRNLLLWHPTTIVIGIVEQPTDKTAMEALIEGVSLCMSRQQPPSEWVATIKHAWSGQLKPEEAIGQHPSIARDALLYLSRAAGLTGERSVVPKVTTREGQVLRSLSEGDAVPQVADRLGVDMDTVYNTLGSVRQKLMRARRLQLLLEALC